MVLPTLSMIVSSLVEALSSHFGLRFGGMAEDRDARWLPLPSSEPLLRKLHRPRLTDDGHANLAGVLHLVLDLPQRLRASAVA